MESAISIMSDALLEEIQRQTHMTTAQMYQFVRRVLPDLCDDDVRCVHSGQDFGQPEWKHHVRNAQQRLARSGKIRLNGDWIAVDEP